MASLSKQDLNFVLSRCPRDVVKILKDNAGKLFLAGGFIRSTIAGEKVSDIDLFGGNADDLLRMAKDLTLDRKGRYFQTKNAITVLAPPRLPVQFITRWLFNSTDKLIDSFDFTVCQAVIWAEVDVVHHFYSSISDSFYPDLAARRMVYTFPDREEEAGGSLLRVIKMVKRGYTIQAPALAGVVTRLIRNVDFDNKFIQKGKDYEKQVARVITGLLRQVDPLTVIDGVDFVDEHETINE